MDVVVKAFAIVRAAPRTRAVAGAQREDDAQAAQRLAQSAHVGVGSEVPCPILPDAPRQQDSRTSLLHRHLDEREALVVLQVDVVDGALLLDQRHLEDERLHVGVGDDVVDLDDASYEGGLLGVGRRPRRGWTDPMVEPLCLADVDDPAGAVLHEIDARQPGQILKLALEAGGLIRS